MEKWAMELEAIRALCEKEHDPHKLARYVYDRMCDYHGQGHGAWSRELIAEAIASAGDRRATEAIHATRSI